MEPAVPLPDGIDGWKATGSDLTFDRETIFDYIDGAGEVYRQYDFRRVLVREYVRADSPAITVQIFDMGRSGDAFGMFSFEREGADVGIGQDSEFEGGLLRFWRGRFLVCVSAEQEAPGTREAVLGLGRAIADAIREPGTRPALLDALPTDGLRRETVRYFHGSHGLATHFPVGEENVLDLGAGTEVILASYPSDGESVRVLLVAYPEERRGPPAAGALARHLRLGQDGLGVSEGGRWRGMRRSGRFLAAVFNAASREAAAGFLDRIDRRLAERRE